MSVENAELRPVGVAEAIRSNLLLVVLLTIAGCALGFVGGSRGEAQSAATTPILLQPLEGNPYYPSRTGEALTNLLTEAQAVRSNAVATLVAERLGITEEPAVLLRGASVKTPTNTQILEITYQDPDPEVALLRSQTFAEVYLEYRRSRAVNEINQQAADYDAQIAPLTAELDSLSAQLDAAEPGSAAAQLLLTRIGDVTDQRGRLQTNRAEVMARPTSPGQVVTPAGLDPAGVLRPELLMPVAGAVLGFSAGVVIAMLRSRADQVLHDAQDVRDLGVPVIATIGGVDPDLDELNAGAALDDQYRKFRVAVLALEKRRPFSLVVAGAGDGERTPLTAIDLATSFARAGLDTVLIDATEHGDGPAQVLAPDDADGLTEVLLGNTMLSNALAPVAPMLWVLSPGHDVAGMSDLFVSDEMAELLVRAKQQSDVVIVASGSMQSADAQSLASMCDAVVIEAREDRTSRPDVERALRALDVLPSAFLGAVYIGGDVTPRGPGFQPETTTHRRQLRRGAQRAELTAGPPEPRPMPTHPDGPPATTSDERWTATAVYDPELRTWVVDAGEHDDTAIRMDEAVARRAGDVDAHQTPKSARKTASAKRTANRTAPTRQPASQPRSDATGDTVSGDNHGGTSGVGPQSDAEPG